MSSHVHITPLGSVIADVFDGPRRIQFVERGAPYIRLGDVEAGTIYLDPLQMIGPLDLDPRLYLCMGDVLMTKTGDEPRAAVVPQAVQGALTAPDIYCFRIQPGSISPVWLSYLLNTPYEHAQLAQRQTGGTLPRLRLADLRSLPILLPSLSLSKEVEDLERQAQAQSQAAQELWTNIVTGLYAEINERVGYMHSLEDDLPTDWFNTPAGQKILQPLHIVAKLAVSSRKTLKPNQVVQYVQASDVDPQSFLFRRVRSAVADRLPSRIRLPLQAYQVLLLASGSNLGTSDHPIAVIEPRLEGCFASNTFLALEFQDTPIYYAMALKHPLVLAQIRQIATGTVVSTLRKKDIVHLRIPVLSSVWRQDFNDRAHLAWERRTRALELRQQAMQKVEAFVQQRLDEGEI